MKQLKKAIPAFLLAFALLLPVACKLNPEAVVRASESTVEPTPEPMPDPNAVVEFKDAAFEKAFRELSGLDGIIRYSDVLSVRNLSFNDCGISDYSDITMFRNLEDLFIFEKVPFDLTPLSKLKNLKSLYLLNDIITDVSALAGLTELEHLCLCGVKITDISTLASLKKLQSLLVGCLNLSDFSPLYGLPELEELTIINHRLSRSRIAEIAKMLPNCSISDAPAELNTSVSGERT